MLSTCAQNQRIGNRDRKLTKNSLDFLRNSDIADGGSMAAGSCRAGAAGLAAAGLAAAGMGFRLEVAAGLG